MGPLFYFNFLLLRRTPSQGQTQCATRTPLGRCGLVGLTGLALRWVSLSHSRFFPLFPFGGFCSLGLDFRGLVWLRLC